MLCAAPFRPGARSSSTDLTSAEFVQCSRAPPRRALRSNFLILGGVASYLSACTTDVAFPALSRHVPVTEPFGLSGPAYATRLQAAIPEVGSAPLKVNATAWL